MESATCASTSKNEMAIAILNSDIYSRLRHDTNHHSSSSSSSSSSSEETLGFIFKLFQLFVYIFWIAHTLFNHFF